MKTNPTILFLKGGVMSIKLYSKLSCADTRKLKGIRTVASLLCSMLPACMVLVSQPAQAGDFTLNVTSGTDVPIDSNANWDTIRSVFLAAQNHAHNCMAVASADIANPGGTVGNQSYIFNVTIDDSNPFTGTSTERTLELLDNSGVDDPSQHPVSVNNVFFAAANVAHTFRFLGRKVGAAINTEAFDGTLSVVCIGS